MGDADESFRTIDLTIRLLDQVCIAQIWLLSNSIFVWMGSGAERPRLSYVSGISLWMRQLLLLLMHLSPC